MELKPMEVDAISNTPVYDERMECFSLTSIMPNALSEILNDLTDDWIVSIIFLMVDDTTNISELIEKLEQNPKALFLELHKHSRWQDKFIETLLVTRNFKVLGRLNISQSVIRNIYSPEIHNVSVNLNKMIKSLFFLCESLDKNQTEKLVTKVNASLNQPITITNDVQLELCILKWIQKGYISISRERPNLRNLAKIVKQLDFLEDLKFNFDYWIDKHENCTRDSSYRPIQNNSESLISINCSNESNGNSIDNREEPEILLPQDHKRMCIIINQINFEKSEHKTRQGTEKDERRLEKTFKGCGFKIEKHQNLDINQMEVVLNSLNKKPYTLYGCIFLCILSHGNKGEIVLSDSKSMSIETIEKKFCCRKLRNTFKMLILQSCQGTNIGLIDKFLEFDGPGDCSPLDNLDYARFQATVDDFAAVRDPEQGTWFVNDICDVLEEAKSPIGVNELHIEVTKRVSKRRANVKTVSSKAVQVPKFIGSLRYNYKIPKYQESLATW